MGGEPSMGLSPTNVLIVFETIKNLINQEVTIVIGGRNVKGALTSRPPWPWPQAPTLWSAAPRSWQAPARTFFSNDRVKKMYLGLS
jgi:ABC-type branched-subunit amino acid transport system ATPase component